MKVYAAKVDFRGRLQLFCVDDKGKYWIRYVHGAIEKFIEELERRGIKVEWDTQIRI